MFDDLIPSPHAADFTVPLLFIALAAAFYIAARAIGWVLDGFLSLGRSVVSRMGRVASLGGDNSPSYGTVR